jgi:chloramphenicol 3-O-phosphotransferase
MKTKEDIIIIGGAPASGKSSTAKALTKFFPSGVRIEVDNLRSMVISVDWTNQDEHISILNLSTNLVYDFYQLKFHPIIVVDTFSGNKILNYHEKLLKLNKNLSIKIFGLYVSNEELERRIGSRNEGEFKDLEICKKLNRDVLKIKHPDEFQIDTTRLTPEDTARIIFDQIIS